VQQNDDEALGFMSRPLRSGAFASLVRAAASASTLEGAMRRLARHMRLLQDDVVLVCLREGQLAGLGLELTAQAAPTAHFNFLHEFLMRVSWRLLAWLHGGSLAARRFDFAFEAPAYAAQYANVFPAPLQFDRPRSAFWFDACALADPIPCDEATLRDFLAGAPANVIMPGVGRANSSGYVRRLLRRAGPPWPDLHAVAEQLHTSASTLQRHLAVEGTSFQALKDEVRRDLAIMRLSTDDVTLAMLAAELGFADGPTFQRAFKTWTGATPGSYRTGRHFESHP